MNKSKDDILKSMTDLKEQFEKELQDINAELNKDRVIPEELFSDYERKEEKRKETEKLQNRILKEEKKLKREERLKTRINNFKNLINMKNLIIVLVIAICCFGVYHFFLKDNEKVKDISYKLTSTEINEILQNPREYEGKEVTVSGKVTSSMSLGIKFYGINDGTGTIYILTDNAVPLEGDLIKVTGEFSQFIKVGSKQYSTITEKKRLKE